MICGKCICLLQFFPSDKLASDRQSTSLDRPVETDETNETEFKSKENFFFFLVKKKMNYKYFWEESNLPTIQKEFKHNFKEVCLKYQSSCSSVPGIKSQCSV